ncbi:transcriptional regulator, Crp family [Hyphomicrobium sulfonivorans]|uniref:Transcriptional regulator, Crp family n=1 Tax=Hyphomicrobium sulfonivorans TaxID=121290 RepID=A0A125NVK5_HYPSL|nr:Crp/Fnr family transcriptional regulator [Hyphomicrobium sulfonivorans]KWT70064.1 transcriptional regulator, Crp family [Hyphomicrobium sulfonivorans]
MTKMDTAARIMSARAGDAGHMPHRTATVLNPAALRGLGDKATTVVYSKGRKVFEQGQPADVVYKVVSGAVVLSAQNDAGHRQAMEVAGAGSFLGFSSAETYQSSAEAISRTMLMRISRDAIEQSPALQRMIGDALTSKLEKLQREASARLRTNAAGALAGFILSLPKADGNGDSGELRIVPAQQDIACCLGLAAATVGRVLRRLRTAGAIMPLSKDRIAILDRDLMEKICVGEAAGF